jgi:hypothetical protein
MEWTRARFKEIGALLVDDGVFACGIVLWLAVVWVLAKLGLPSVAICLPFFAGLAALLLQSALKRAGQP